MSLRTLATSEPITTLTGIVTSVLDSKSDGERHSAIFRIKVDNQSYRVVCHFGVISAPPSVHDIWRIIGQHKYDSKYGPQFVATTGERLPIETCTDQTLVCEYIIQNPAFSGIGCVWVDKLNNAFPKTLVQTLESIDTMELMEHPKLKMPEILAESLLLGWRHCATEMKLLAFLGKKKIPRNLAHELIRLLGTRSIECIENDPYRLLAFMPAKDAMAQWRTVDSIARKQFAIKKDDPRRAISAIEAILYQAYDCDGHMAMPITYVQHALDYEGIKYNVSDVVQQHGQYSLIIHHELGLVQNLGHFALEKIVAKRLNDIAHSHNSHPIAFRYNILIEYEEQARIKKKFFKFKLDEMQSKVVKFVTESRLSQITGGGGTGKTTIISAIVHQHEVQKRPVWLLAPTGKAARRLAEESGHKTETVFSFVLQIRERIRAGELFQALIIIDEASMLDTPSAYAMLKLIPNNCRLCLVGDVKQLEPVGPGLVFHQLASDPKLCMSLSRPYRQEGISDLHKFCDAVGKQDIATAKSVLYQYDEYPEADVTWYQPENVSVRSMCKATLDIWYEKRNTSKTLQLLAATRKVCQEINQELQLIRTLKKRLASKEIYDRNFIEGDPIIYGQNNKFLGISNGSTGEITKIFDKSITIDCRECIIQIDFEEEGTKYLTETECLFLDLAYCITTHKSQGSQYDDVIVIFDADYLIDNSWMYTAASRARNSVVFISNYYSIEKTIVSCPNATRRYIGNRIVIQEVS